MKHIKHYFGIALLTSLISVSSFGQCNTNTSICTPGTAGPFTFVSPGAGVSTCLDWIGPNTGYIILHITSSGPLNMLIDGNSSSGFLDVAVFNIPAGQSPCTAIQNTSNQIGCNYASASSGCNQFGSSFPCSSSVPAPNVTAGQELMIVVENWSGSSSNFTLQLGPPPGAQTGPPNPAITPVGPFCTTSGSVQLIAADMGGSWSGPGVSPTGTFNPATAGPGTHTINYSIGTAPCNASSSTTITVNSASVTVSPNTTICPGGSATLTAGNAATYTWSPTTGLSPTTGATVTASPPTTTTYTVTGTTAGCNSTANVTVTVGGSPAVNAVPNQNLCVGTNAAATVFSGGAAGTVYNWTNSDPSIGIGASGTGSLPGFTPVNGTTSPVTATITVTPTLGSCTGTPITFTITVNNSSVTVSPNTSICPGGSVPLAANGAASYSWSPATGLSSATGANVTSTPASTTTYTVTGTSGTCTSTANVTVTVGGSPGVNPVTDQSFCAGTTTSSTAFSGGSAGTVYDWTNSNPAIGLPGSGTGSIPAFTATNAGSSPITSTITVTPSVGTCTGPAITFTITINPQPTITAANNGPLCEGAQMDLTASTVTGGVYSWSGPNGFGGGTQNASIPNAPASAFGTYTVTVTGNGGCTASTTTTVAMNPGTQPVLTPVGPFCGNAAPVTLTASVPGGAWSGTGITNPNTGQFDPSAAAIGANIITYTPNNGCTNPVTLSIVIDAIPAVQFFADNLTGCVPLTVNFTNQSVPASNSVTWNFGDNTATSGNINTTTHTFFTAGCYDITLTTTTAAGCSNTRILQNYICAVPQASANFTVDDYTQTITDPTFQFLNTSVNATSYTWDFGDGEQSQVINPSHSYDESAGSYTIVLVADNSGGCRDTARLTVQVEDELIFHVPNAFTPDGDEYNNTFQAVFFSGYDPFSFTMTIYDRWGEILFESHDVNIGWDGTYNGATAKEGIYTWTIRFKNTGSDKKSVFTGHLTLID